MIRIGTALNEPIALKAPQRVGHGGLLHADHARQLTLRGIGDQRQPRDNRIRTRENFVTLNALRQAPNDAPRQRSDREAQKSFDIDRRATFLVLDGFILQGHISSKYSSRVERIAVAYTDHREYTTTATHEYPTSRTRFALWWAIADS